MGNHPPFMPINTWLSCIEVGRFAIESFTSVLNTLRTSKIFELSSPILLFIIASIVCLNLDIFGSKGSFFVYSYNKIGHFLIIAMRFSTKFPCNEVFFVVLVTSFDYPKRCSCCVYIAWLSYMKKAMLFESFTTMNLAPLPCRFRR